MSKIGILLLCLTAHFLQASDLPSTIKFDGGTFEFRQNVKSEDSQLFVYTDKENPQEQWVARFSILIQDEQMAPGTWINALKGKIIKNGGTITGEKIPESEPDAGMLVFIKRTESSFWKVENLSNGQLIAYELTFDWPDPTTGIQWLRTHQQEVSVKMLNFKFPIPE
jgi:hypothetical protein